MCNCKEKKFIVSFCCLASAEITDDNVLVVKNDYRTEAIDLISCAECGQSYNKSDFKWIITK
jgi:hypothetical protein